MRHLQDHQHYQKLSGDPTALFERAIKFFLEDMENHLSINKKKNRASLTPEKVKLPIFTFSQNTLTRESGKSDSLILWGVDYHLVLLVKGIHVPSCIKDTTDFLNKL